MNVVFMKCFSTLVTIRCMGFNSQDCKEETWKAQNISTVACFFNIDIVRINLYSFNQKVEETVIFMPCLLRDIIACIFDKILIMEKA